MSESKVIKSVSIDFISQVSDLRKREEYLLERQFFGPEPNSSEGERIRKELQRTRNALALIEDLEVSPD